MDYYYALLENYQQLKQRKFKLSLREQNEDAEGEAKTAIAGAAQLDFENKAPVDGFSDGIESTGAIWKSGLSDKPPRDDGGTVFTFTPDGTGFRINVDEPEGFQQLVNFISGDEGTTSTGGGEDTPQEVDPAEIKARAETEKLADGVVSKLKKMLDVGVEKFFPGMRKEKHTRRTTTLINVLGDDAKGYTGAAEDIEEKIFATPDDQVSQAEKQKGLENLDRSLGFLQTYHEKGWFQDPSRVLEGDTPMTAGEAEELKEAMRRMEFTDKGVSFDGVFFFYRNHSTSESDPLRNLADQFNTVAKAYNSQFEAQDDERKKKNQIPLITDATPPKSGGADESYRGPVAEKFMKVSAIVQKTRLLWEQAKTPEEKKKILHDYHDKMMEVLEEAQEDGSMEKMVKVFGRGRMVELGQYIGTDITMKDASYTEAVRNILIFEKGMDPETADRFLEEAGDDMAKALLMTSFVNQSFDQEVWGNEVELIPDHIKHEGAIDSDSSGRKADVILKWDDPSVCEPGGAVYDHYKDLLGPTVPKGDEKKAEESDSCNSDAQGVGMDQVLTKRSDGEEGCQMSMELKTLTSSQSTGGAGLSSGSRTDSVCNPNAKIIQNVMDADGKLIDSYGLQVLAKKINAEDGMSQATADYKVANDERLENCLGAGTIARACDEHARVKKESEKLIQILTPGNGSTTTRRLALDSWWEHKTHDEDGRERYDAAQRALEPATAYDLPPYSDMEEKELAKQKKEDDAHLNKVHGDMIQAVLKRDIPQGEVTDKNMIDYLSSRYSLGVGSTEEVLRTSRGIEDGYQGVYLNNATVQRNLKKIKDGAAQWVRSGGTLNLIDKTTGETLASCDTARGEFKWNVGENTSEIISGTQGAGESREDRTKVFKARKLKLKKQKAAGLMAPDLHQQWADNYREEAKGDNPPDDVTYRHSDGTVDNDPTDGVMVKMEPVEDEVWIEKHDGLTEVDILATPYPDLPKELQKEQKIASKAAIEAVVDSESEAAAIKAIIDASKEDMPEDKARLLAKEAARRLGKKWKEDSKKEENLMLSFLKGQQNLLEKLMHQTT
jgi:hypothetical protein